MTEQTTSKLKMPVFSFSRLSLYQTCPRHFYYKYVLEQDEPVTLPLALGKAEHKAIEMYVSTDDSYDEALLKGYAESDFFPELDKKELVWLFRNSRAVKKMGKVEEHFCLPLSSDPDGPQLQGYIDLRREDRIRDWKTNRKMYEPTDTMQLPLYSWAVHVLYGYQLVEGELYFLRFRKSFKQFFGLYDMENARQWALKLANEINMKLEIVELFPEKAHELFPYHASSLCSFCPFSLQCFYQK